MHDVPPSIEALGQHTGQCVQCQDAAREALVGPEPFWNEETWELLACVEGIILRQAAIDALQSI